MGGGARSCSRRDEDGGWREKRHGGDGSTLLTVRRGWEQRKVGPGSGRWPHGGEELETGVGTGPAVGRRGVVGTGPEPMCSGRRRAVV
jgi:hypothetical protein